MSIHSTLKQLIRFIETYFGIGTAEANTRVEPGDDNTMTTPLYSSSPAPSYVEEKPAATMTAPKPKASIWRRLFGCWLAPLPSETAAFAPTRAAPLSLLPPRATITTKVTNARLCCCRSSSMKATSGATNTSEDNKLQVVCVKASVSVTVRACCCGPDGREISASSSYHGDDYTDGVKLRSPAREDSVATGTAQATESAAKKSYDHAVANATATAVASLERKFAKRASKALYRK